MRMRQSYWSDGCDLEKLHDDRANGRIETLYI
jgi:hypothetical protein